MRFRDRYLTIMPCEARPKAKAAVPPLPPPRPSRPSVGYNTGQWMKGFDLRKSPPLWAILQRESGQAAGAREGS